MAMNEWLLHVYVKVRKGLVLTWAILRIWGSWAISARPDFEDHASYKDEAAWYGGFSPEKDGYARIREYGEKKYEEAMKIYATLDQKAEWCFALGSGGVAGVFLMAEKMSLSRWLCVPSIIAFAVAMGICVRARLPGRRPTPMTTRGVIEIHEKGHDVDARIAASQHCATCGIRSIVSWKSQKVGAAAYALVAGACLFIIPFLFSKAHQENPARARAAHILPRRHL